MPYKPKRPCSFPGCPNLTDGRFCPEHERLENKRYEKYDRNPETKRRYGRAWKRIRDKYVQQHPFCELCYKKGLLVETEQVHHIKPLSEAGINLFISFLYVENPILLVFQNLFSFLQDFLHPDSFIQIIYNSFLISIESCRLKSYLLLL